MKKLINDPRGTVRELLEGLVDSDPGLAILDHENVVLRADIPEDPAQRAVAVLSGGGAGHEPAHAGLVGRGMLSAAISGDVFTSPSADAVLAGLRAAAGPAGALLVVKNYTGDRLNFSLAAEMAKAEGIPTEVVMVADDVALRDRLARDQSRGIAGTVLVHKIAGAAIEAGRDLAQVTALARKAADDLASMGIGLGSCIVPAAGTPGFELGEREIEFGLGIHGEKGLRRAEIASADQITGDLLDALISHGGISGEVALLVNGLGGTPPMELSIMARAALAGLRARGVTPRLVWTGNFMTALEMPGCSLTLLPLDAERQALLTAPTTVRFWPASAEVPQTRNLRSARSESHPADGRAPGPLAPAMKRAVSAVAAALEEAEPRLTALDAAGGDGDLGASMERGALALRAMPDGAYADPRTLLASAADALRKAIAGSSGPFYAAALMRAANALPDGAPAAQDWQEAFLAASRAVQDIGGAAPGDRTMVDALAPAAAALEAALARNDAMTEALLAAAAAARTGAEATQEMLPKFGRAAYLGERARGTPDGGATAIGIWMTALAESFVGAPA